MGDIMSLLASLLEAYYPALLDTYGDQMTREQHKAIAAARRCHTSACGSVQCDCPHCHLHQQFFHGCGHRWCPCCQQDNNSDWLQRQQAKWLPVPYFMVTFTLPASLRPLARHYPKAVFNALFDAAIETLKQFALNDRRHALHVGATAVLHTHSRQLQFHPHVHMVVPGGGVRTDAALFQTLQQRYLFNGKAMGKVFAAKVRQLLTQHGFWIPKTTPTAFVVQCQYVGKGVSALKYLSRYLYRSVLSEHQLLDYQDGRVTFRFREAKSGQDKVLTLPVVEFLWRLLQHVLPDGFRRVRDYGLLHSAARKIRQRLQYLLGIALPDFAKQAHAFLCPCCRLAMSVRFVPPLKESTT